MQIDLVDALGSVTKEERDLVDRTFVWEIGGLVPCSLCTQSAPVGTGVDRYHVCLATGRVVCDSAIKAGCPDAKRRPGTEHLDRIAVAIEDGEFVIDAVGPEDLAGLDNVRHCGPLLRLGGLR